MIKESLANITHMGHIIYKKSIRKQIVTYLKSLSQLMEEHIPQSFRNYKGAGIADGNKKQETVGETERERKPT